MFCKGQRGGGGGRSGGGGGHHIRLVSVPLMHSVTVTCLLNTSANSWGPASQCVVVSRPVSGFSNRTEAVYCWTCPYSRKCGSSAPSTGILTVNSDSCWPPNYVMTANTVNICSGDGSVLTSSSLLPTTTLYRTTAASRTHPSARELTCPTWRSKETVFYRKTFRHSELRWEHR